MKKRPSEITIHRSPNQVIEDKLLAALDDETKVAILLDEQDLRDLHAAEANEFAMHLLMPEEFVIAECKKLGGVDLTDDRKIKKLANLFKVPIYAMSARLSQIEMNGMN